MRAFTLAAAVLLGLAPAAPALAQDRPADTLEILLEKIRSDKKLLVATNMSLTEAEAKGFWPVYEEYQTALADINRRTGSMIKQYAETGGTVTEDLAGKMLDDFIKLEKDRAALLETFRPRFGKVLPATKVGRYYQIENKIKAVVMYELASVIPLM